jgi:hypothetical protein
VNFKEDVSSNEAEKWLQAVNEQFESIKKNVVWKLTNLPNQRKAIR